MTTETLHQFKPYAPKKGEEYMDENMRKHFEQILVEWKKNLIEEAGRTVNTLKEEATNFADMADRASQEEEFSIELRTRDRERKLIRKIDLSLFDLKEGSYGYCESCGVEIGLRRLEARPTAKLCIDCKTLSEMKEKHLHD